jgi:hypothetical protein
MSDYTPSTAMIREHVAWIWSRGSEEESQAFAMFDRWLTRHDAEVWDKGHKTPWRRGPDACTCGAWSVGECGCGERGNGELLSLADNPYHTIEEDRS